MYVLKTGKIPLFIYIVFTKILPFLKRKKVYHKFNIKGFFSRLIATSLTLKVLVATVDALGHFETG